MARQAVEDGDDGTNDLIVSDVIRNQRVGSLVRGRARGGHPVVRANIEGSQTSCVFGTATPRSPSGNGRRYSSSKRARSISPRAARAHSRREPECG